MQKFRMFRLIRDVTVAALSSAFLLTPCSAEETVKIAFIDPLSGPNAIIGSRALKHFQFMADRLNGEGGVDGRKFEIVAFDSESSPEKALIMLKLAIDQGIRYVAQGGSTPVGYAITDAVSKYNRRNPSKSVIFLDFGDLDTALTNEKCSFWHFRFDANVAMRTNALTNYIASQPRYKRIYLFNPDYPSGVEVEKTSIEMLRAKRPDIEIVGVERIPVGKIKDFSPYVAKMQTAGADAVITMNLSFDMILLAKAAKEANLRATLFTYFGGYPGIPAALGRDGMGVVLVSDWNSNLGVPEFEQMSVDYKTKYKEDYFHWRVSLTMNMFAEAIRKTGSIEPIKVGYGLEGLVLDTPIGKYRMRKDDHQIIEPLYISQLEDGVKFDIDDTGLGLKTLKRVPAEEAEMPTTCRMERPAP